MILNRRMILEHIAKGNISIDPFDENLLNPNSYDVCLGNYFVDVYFQTVIEDGKKERKLVFSEPYFIPDGKKIFIPTGGTLLGMTREVIKTVDCIVGEIRAKSTTRRMGITVCDDAGFGDIGYNNNWTVELTAHITNGKPYLIVGNPFAQMVFFLSEYLEPEYQYQGQYREEFPLAMIPKRFRL